MRPWQTTILDLTGSALIVTGLALVFVPAAFLASGAALLLISWRAART